jgi:diadenosine tetraphosphate (Ap4A) HIT family hydrolase
MPAPFKLDEQLAKDSFAFASWNLCDVRMMNAQQWPWLILVPRRGEVTELHELSPADRRVLVEEIARASGGIDKLFRAEKINIGMLGNRVRQFHVHVVARFKDDPAWPGPVWGHERTPYETAALAVRVRRLREALAGK